MYESRSSESQRLGGRRSDSRRALFWSLDGHSYVDPVSNLAVLGRVNLSDDLASIIEGRFDALRLPVLIHEFRGGPAS